MSTNVFSNDDLFNDELINKVLLTQEYRNLDFDYSSDVAGIAYCDDMFVSYMTDQYGHIVYRKKHDDFNSALENAVKLYGIMLDYLGNSEEFYKVKD